VLWFKMRTPKMSIFDLFNFRRFKKMNKNDASTVEPKPLNFSHHAASPRRSTLPFILPKKSLVKISTNNTFKMVNLLKVMTQPYMLAGNLAKSIICGVGDVVTDVLPCGNNNSNRNPFKKDTTEDRDDSTESGGGGNPLK